MSETECRCLVCTAPPWAIPAGVAVLLVVVLVLIGGGHYPWPVDAAVYLAAATMAYAATSRPVMQWRWRHADR
ncbi:hypothetical protein ACWGCC_37870 [Streptomyces nigrescens]